MTDADRLLNQTVTALGLAYGGAKVEYNRASDWFDRVRDPVVFEALQTRRTHLHALVALVGTLPTEVQTLVRARAQDIVDTAEEP